MSNLYNNINESFDEVTGSIGPNGYVNFSGATPTTIINTYQTHYDLRNFAANNDIQRTTMADLLWHPVGYYGGSGIANNLSVGQMQSLYVYNPFVANIENWVLTTSGVGGSILSSTPITVPVGGSSIISNLGVDSNYRYSNSLSMTFTGTVSGTFTSKLNDNILTNFNTLGDNYNITMTVRNMPTQGNAAGTIDLTRSYLDITSDPNFAPSSTDSIVFSTFSSLNVASNSDTNISFNRSLLVNSNPANLQGVRFRIVPKNVTTGFTVKFQNLRVAPNEWSYPSAAIDTRLQRYSGSMGISGTISPQSSTPYFFYPSQPKNLIQNVRFNTGTSPAIISGTNSFSSYFRYNVDPNTLYTSNIQTTLTSSGSNTNIHLYQTFSGTTWNIGNFGATLSGSTDYLLQTTIQGEHVQASLFNVNSSFIDPLVNTTGKQTLPAPSAKKTGYVGWNFQPYNYDFQIDEITMQRVEFGTITTDPFGSFKPVYGAQLTANTSNPITLLDTNNFTQFGDGTIYNNPQGGNPPPDFILNRSGGATSWYGGIISSGTYYIGDPNELYIAGSIFPYPLSGITYSGTYQIGLLNKHSQVAFVTNLNNIIGGQWNNFILPLRPNIVSGKYYIVIRNIGLYTNTFEVDNINLYHNTISWSASNDGANFQPFYDNINDQYAMITFTAARPQLQLKGAALSDKTNWIESFVLTPKYLG